MLQIAKHHNPINRYTYCTILATNFNLSFFSGYVIDIHKSENKMCVEVFFCQIQSSCHKNFVSPRILHNFNMLHQEFFTYICIVYCNCKATGYKLFGEIKNIYWLFNIEINPIYNASQKEL